MKIPEKEYVHGELRQYLIDNPDSIFEDEKKKWLKIYCIMVGDDNWKETLFSQGEIQPLGVVHKITLKNDDGDTVYYIEQDCPGLLLLYSTGTNAEYEEHLGTRIKKTRGVSRMWLKPNLYRLFWKGVMDETGGYIYRFSGYRGAFDDRTCKVRPNYTRRMGYTGDDGTQTLEELEEMYGISPYMMYMAIAQNVKIHLTNHGLFSVQEASSFALELFYKYLDEIKNEAIKIMQTSQSFKFDIVTENNLKVASIDAGLIEISDDVMDPATANALIQYMEDFSFVDVNIETGSFGMSATVVDDVKGSVFDVNVSESMFVLIPKYKVTFESFIDFYKGIVELIDENAKISLVKY